MNEHTQSQWQVQEYSDRFEIQTADGVVIVEIIRTGVNEQEWAQELKIANLIAAAPDLLAACAEAERQRDELLAARDALRDAHDSLAKIYDGVLEALNRALLWRDELTVELRQEQVARHVAEAQRDELLAALEKTGDQREELAERVKKLEATGWTEADVDALLSVRPPKAEKRRLADVMARYERELRETYPCSR